VTNTVGDRSAAVKRLANERHGCNELSATPEGYVPPASISFELGRQQQRVRSP